MEWVNIIKKMNGQFNSDKVGEIETCKSKLRFPSRKKCQFKCYYFKHYYLDGRERTPYFCKICGGWHITTQEKS